MNDFSGDKPAVIFAWRVRRRRRLVRSRQTGLFCGERTTCFLAPAFCAAETLTYSLPEETATLHVGPGQEIARKNCAACHSGDYIERQPLKMGRAFWESVVKKMTQSDHAQIDESDAQKIIDYLAATY